MRDPLSRLDLMQTLHRSHHRRPGGRPSCVHRVSRQRCAPRCCFAPSGRPHFALQLCFGGIPALEPHATHASLANAGRLLCPCVCSMDPRGVAPGYHTAVGAAVSLSSGAHAPHSQPTPCGRRPPCTPACQQHLRRPSQPSGWVSSGARTQRAIVDQVRCVEPPCGRHGTRCSPGTARHRGCTCGSIGGGLGSPPPLPLQAELWCTVGNGHPRGSSDGRPSPRHRPCVDGVRGCSSVRSTRGSARGARGCVGDRCEQGGWEGDCAAVG